MANSATKTLRQRAIPEVAPGRAVVLLSAATAASVVESAWRSLECTPYDLLAKHSSVAVVVAGSPAVRDALAAALGTSGPAITVAGDRYGGLEALHIAYCCLQAGSCEAAIVAVADRMSSLVIVRADAVDPDEMPAAAAWIDACVWAAPESAVAAAWAFAGGGADPVRTVRLDDDGDNGLAELASQLAASGAERKVAYVATAPDARHTLCVVARADSGRTALVSVAPKPGTPAPPPPAPSGDDGPAHPLLGRRLSSPLDEIQFAARVGPASHPWTVDHRVFAVPILPGAAMIEMMIAAATAGPGWPVAEVVLRDLHIRRARPFDGGEAADLATVLAPAGENRFEATLHGRSAGRETWILHAVGTLERAAAPHIDAIDPQALRRGLADEVPLADHYAAYAARGIIYGPAFQGVTFLCRGRGRAVALLRCPPGATGNGHLIHPALLDAAIQVVPAAFDAPPDGTHVPVAMAEARFAQAIADELWCEAVARHVGTDGRTLTADLRLFALDGRLVGTIRGIELIHTTAEALGNSGAAPAAEAAARPSAAQPDPKPVAEDSPASLATLFPAERRVRLTRIVHDAVAAILGLPADATVDRSAGFFTLGIDSMSAVDLHRQLKYLVGVDFPATAVFNHSSVAALSEYLDGRFAAADSQTSRPPAEPSPAARVEEMSSEEATAALWQEIDKAAG